MSQVRVTEFTDPYCSWCWGAEPVARRLREVYRDQVEFEYVMGGLYESFEQFNDPAGDDGEGGEGGDIAVHWQAAAQQHGMPVDVSLWHEDPPSSSYPACVAYEAAALQDEALAGAFLRRMREAGIALGSNLEREAVVADLAGQVGLDVEQFRADLGSEAAREAFAADQRTAREQAATSFPTFRVVVDGEAEVLRGYKPFPSFQKLFAEADVDLAEQEPRPVADLLDHYGRMATQEIAEIRGLTAEEARSRLADLAGEGRARRIESGTDYLWEPA